MNHKMREGVWDFVHCDLSPLLLTALTTLHRVWYLFICRYHRSEPCVVDCPNLTVCMTLPGGGCRLQTCRGLAAQWFDSTLRTLLIVLIPSWIERVTVPNVAELTLISIRSLIGLTTMQYPCIIRYHWPRGTYRNVMYLGHISLGFYGIWGKHNINI